MAITITPITAPQNPDLTGREIVVDGTAVLSGTYGGVNTNGDTLDLTQLRDLLKSSQLPTKVEVFEDPPSGTAPFFAQFVYCPGTTQANGVLSIALAGVQLVGGTTYAGQTTDITSAVLRVRAWFPAY
jgi:hypothetical protein